MLALELLVQWGIYHLLLHHGGPVRIVGSLIAGALTFAFAYIWQESTRRRRLHQLEISEQLVAAQDRVRNSLQAIECVIYAGSPETTEPVRDAVDVIENTLAEAFRTAPARRTRVAVQKAVQARPPDAAADNAAESPGSKPRRGPTEN